MDMNYYLHREQVERVRADQAGPGAVGDAHRGLADLYRREIERYRADGHPAFRAAPGLSAGTIVR